jgi:hypothetical protein
MRLIELESRVANVTQSALRIFLEAPQQQQPNMGSERDR